MKIGNIFKHYKNHNFYRVYGFCKIQIADEWVDAVIYQQCNLFGAVASTKYVRTKEEFKEKFSFAEENFICNVYDMNDGTSFLEQLRNFQLTDILGKFKIF